MTSRHVWSLSCWSIPLLAQMHADQPAMTRHAMPAAHSLHAQSNCTRPKDAPVGGSWRAGWRHNTCMHRMYPLVIIRKVHVVPQLFAEDRHSKKHQPGAADTLTGGGWRAGGGAAAGSGCGGGCPYCGGCALCGAGAGAGRGACTACKQV